MGQVGGKIRARLDITNIFIEIRNELNEDHKLLNNIKLHFKQF